MTSVGFTLQPDDEFLARTASIAARADHLEVTPETLWYEREDGALVPNGFHARFLAAGRALGKRFVAHSVGLSTGSEDGARQDRWIARMREDHRAFDFLWWTDHLGATSLAGEQLALPMPIPMTEERAAIVRANVERMREIVPDAGLENSVVHFTIGDPMDEPAFLREALGDRGWLLLDLHNVHTMALNLGFEARDWIARCDLDRVIEIHVSGGSDSDPRWLRSRRSVRLDGHDGAVPEEVWSLLAETLPRCPNLRGVTLERMEGTVTGDEDAHALSDELDRLIEAVR